MSTESSLSSSIHEIKHELFELDKKDLINICLRLGKFKVENKELLSYLLFHSENESLYVTQVKHQMDEQFEDLNKTNFFLAKKTIRKVLRIANKHIRFTGNKISETEIRIHFCKLVLSADLKIERHPVLLNLYTNQLKKISKLIDKLEDDLQYDYKRELADIQLL